MNDNEIKSLDIIFAMAEAYIHLTSKDLLKNQRETSEIKAMRGKLMNFIVEEKKESKKIKDNVTTSVPSKG